MLRIRSHTLFSFIRCALGMLLLIVWLGACASSKMVQRRQQKPLEGPAAEKVLPSNEQAGEREVFRLLFTIERLQKSSRLSPGSTGATFKITREVEPKSPATRSTPPRVRKRRLREACRAICQASGGIRKAATRICAIAKRFPKKMFIQACGKALRDQEQASKRCSLCQKRAK